MNNREPTIRVNVDVTNPGQFFACCGLMELGDRLWPGAEGWFEGATLRIGGNATLSHLISALSNTKLVQVDPGNSTSSPIEVNGPFGRLRLDWWHDDRAGGSQLKVWAGSMESVRIAQAMQNAVRNDRRFQSPDLFNLGLIVYDPEHPEKKVEPFYFDARRAPNAHSRDVGFAPNDLQMTTTAFPAVELLCLIGLQRCRPARTRQTRVFDYFTWSWPLAPELLPAVVVGELSSAGCHRYRFENSYRTGQRKHKAFRSAISLT